MKFSFKPMLTLSMLSMGALQAAPASERTMAMTLDPSAALSFPADEQSAIVGDAESPPTSSTKGGAAQENSQKWRMFNPNSLKDSYNLWVDVEALYWHSNMDCLDYGITSKSSTSIDDGHVKQPDFQWDWGFRFGMGYKLPHDRWELFGRYTYVHGKAHGHAGDSDRVVFPSWATNFGTAPISPFFAASARVHWQVNLNMGDIELGRTCNVGRWLTIRPFMGVRALFIDQNYKVEYKGGSIAPGGEDKVHLDSDFWGVGARMGADTLWGLGLGFSIYGNVSAALLSGHFDVHEHEKRKDVDIMQIKRDVNNVVVTADFALGLQWDYMLSRDRYHLGFKFGWEFDMFFDQNQLFNFLGPDPGAVSFNDEDLSFQGITLGFRFDF